MTDDVRNAETGTAHFDGVLSADRTTPDDFVKVEGVGAVFLDPSEGTLVMTGRPNDDHNCDVRGCGSVDHKIAEFDVDADVIDGPACSDTQCDEPADGIYSNGAFEEPRCSDHAEGDHIEVVSDL